MGVPSEALHETPQPLLLAFKAPPPLLQKLLFNEDLPEDGLVEHGWHYPEEALPFNQVAGKPLLHPCSFYPHEPAHVLYRHSPREEEQLYPLPLSAFVALTYHGLYLLPYQLIPPQVFHALPLPHKVSRHQGEKWVVPSVQLGGFFYPLHIFLAEFSYLGYHPIYQLLI